MIILFIRSSVISESSMLMRLTNSSIFGNTLTLVDCDPICAAALFSMLSFVIKIIRQIDLVIGEDAIVCFKHSKINASLNPFSFSLSSKGISLFKELLIIFSQSTLFVSIFTLLISCEINCFLTVSRILS